MKQLSKFLLQLSVTFLFGLVSRAQTPLWQKSSHWILYNTRGEKFYKVVINSLGKYNKRPLNDDSMRTFLAQSVALPSDKPPMWMGAYVASCTINNSMRKIDISSYGGFFFDETEKKYYTVPQAVQKDWLNYLADCVGSIPSQK